VYLFLTDPAFVGLGSFNNRCDWKPSQIY